jgi:predicted nucleic acid-binding protein
VSLYVDSSAVLAWLLEESGGFTSAEAISSAERIATSALTLLECARGLSQARQSGRISRARELGLLSVLDATALDWFVIDITETVLANARTDFPVEPVRALDSIHLASALHFRDAIGEISILSLDKRLRDNALALGIPVLP